MDYNNLLKPYPNKGECGAKEIHDKPEDIEKAIDDLAIRWLAAECVMVITGAGISTSAGVPDFRSKTGVWTLAEKGEAAKEVDWKHIMPTATHTMLTELANLGKVQWLVSQNVDDLHRRSGFPRSKLAELHGNLFKGVCRNCGREYFFDEPILSVGYKKIDVKCQGKANGMSCRGYLRDSALDWEGDLPAKELKETYKMLKKCDLLVVLGTSLQIEPIGGMPKLAQNRDGGGCHVVTINLQPTKYELELDNKIHADLDTVCHKLIMRIRELVFIEENPIIDNANLANAPVPEIPVAVPAENVGGEENPMQVGNLANVALREPLVADPAGNGEGNAMVRDRNLANVEAAEVLDEDPEEDPDEIREIVEIGTMGPHEDEKLGRRELMRKHYLLMDDDRIGKHFRMGGAGSFNKSRSQQHDIVLNVESDSEDDDYDSDFEIVPPQMHPH